jgi:hypothetical protein
MRWTKKNVEVPQHLRTKVENGFGLGSDDSYLGWDNFGQPKAAGTAGNMHAIKARRRISVPTESDRAFYFLAERDRRLKQVRERFPILELKQTLRLAGRLGIDHPGAIGKPEPVVIPFLLDYEHEGEVRLEAIALVSEAELEDDAPVSELDIQRAWCSQRSIGWNAVLRKPLEDRTLLESLVFLRSWSRLRYEPDEAEVERLALVFERLHDRSTSLGELLKACASKLRIEQERCTNIFRYAGWCKAIPVDPFKIISLRSPVALVER